MRSLIEVRLAGLAAIFCLMLLVGGEAFGQSNRISGQVYGANRQPLSDVYIELQNEINVVINRARTNGAGAFQFTGMTSGRFTILARPFGTDYEEQSQEVEILNMVSGGRRTSDAANVDFYLRARKANAPRSAATGVVFGQEVPADAQKAFSRAVTEFEADRPDAGLIELDAALKVFPEYFLALERMGVEMLKRQKFADAKHFFERAVAVNAKSSNSWYGLAYARYVENQVAESVEAAQKAVVLAPESADINLMLGVALRKNKQYRDAESSMLKAKKISNGKLADASWNLALLYVYNLKDTRLAADELENYLRVRPDHPNASQLRKLINQFRNGA